MNKQEVQNEFYEWFTARGFSSSRGKTFYRLDKKFYYVTGELRPWRVGGGYFLHIGVTFYWNTSGGYGYSNGSIRIQPPGSEHMDGIIFFDDFELYDSVRDTEKVRIFKELAEKEVEEYLKLTDLEYLHDRLVNRQDFIATANRGFKDRDHDLAAVKMLLGKDIEGAKRLYSNTNRKGHLGELLALCDDRKAYIKRLLEIINETKRTVARKWFPYREVTFENGQFEYVTH